jgi:hypothetical protein
MTRDVRLCNECKVVGDEKHFIYDCPTIDRSKLTNLPASLDKLSAYEQLPTLLNNLSVFL